MDTQPDSGLTVQTDVTFNDTAERCPRCGGDASNNWFDRSICPEPCDSMHTRCDKCGYALYNGCPFEEEGAMKSDPPVWQLGYAAGSAEGYDKGFEDGYANAKAELIQAWEDGWSSGLADSSGEREDCLGWPNPYTPERQHVNMPGFVT